MFGSNTLELALGLLFLLLLFSLLATILTEIIASVGRLRANTLKQALYRMLEDSPEKETGLAKAFYSHPVIQKLTADKRSLPSYITASTFGEVVTEILMKDGAHQNIQAAVAAMPDGETKQCLLTWAQANESNSTFRTRCEQWFRDTMDRTTGWYKRKLQLIVFGVGLALAIGLNVDSIRAFRGLNQDRDLREQLTAVFSSNPEAGQSQAADDHGPVGRMNRSKSDATGPLDSTGARDTTTRSGGGQGLKQKRSKPGKSSTANPSDQLASEYQKLISESLRNDNRLLAIGWRGFEQELREFRCSEAAPADPRAKGKKQSPPETRAVEKTGNDKKGERAANREQRSRIDKTVAKKRTWSEWIQCSPITFWFLKGLGWLLTAVAIVLGAPLWFDLLRRVMHIRGTGHKPA